MAEFGVDVDRILENSERIKNSATRINELGYSLDEIRKGGVFYASVGSMVDESVRRQFERILNEAAKMDSFANALQLIADKYCETEKLLISNITGEGANAQSNGLGAASEAENEDNRNWVQKFWDWITGKDSNREPTPEEQEKAANEAMKKQMKEVLRDSKYSKWNWEHASIEERKQILQDYMNEVIRIYGLQDVDATIHWDPDATYERSKITWGYYSPDYHTVTLNESVLSGQYGNWDSYDLLETIGHELRHAYQYEAVAHPDRFTVSQGTLDTWKHNIDNYLDSDTYGYKAYRDQPIEVDARDFQVKRFNWFGLF